MTSGKVGQRHSSPISSSSTLLLLLRLLLHVLLLLLLHVLLLLLLLLLLGHVMLLLLLLHVLLLLLQQLLMLTHGLVVDHHGQQWLRQPGLRRNVQRQEIRTSSLSTTLSPLAGSATWWVLPRDPDVAVRVGICFRRGDVDGCL
ncbi:MAG: hypothetical protein LGB70_07415 [Sulfurovum sp.]|nr:hypothetical protein [Sulfurovum sp.]